MSRVVRVFTLYTRAGCPLCDEMADAVRPPIEAAGHRLQPLDVDADPALKARFGWDVPLLFEDDAEICRHFPDLDALRARLAADA
ncbi:MAG: glutaredoxin family protein [Pseudomonadota bacterium]